MSDEQRQRAASYALREMAAAGKDSGWLIAEAQIDRQTVEDFLAGRRWPQRQTRKRMEDALGLGDGMLELVARGVVDDDQGTLEDPVEVAIQNSTLTRGQKAKLIGSYYDMLDSQSERGTA